AEWAALPPVHSPSRRPRRVLLVVIVCFTLASASCVGCLAAGYRASVRGVDYVTAELPHITQPWSATALIERASPGYLDAMPEAKIRLFISFVEARLGPLKKMGDVNRGPWQSFIGTQGFFVLSSESVDCTFEKASAQVTLVLIWRGDRWQIQGFHLNSDAL